MGASPADATRRVPPDGASPEPQGPQQRWPTGWRLPKSVLDDMRRDLRCEMDRETAEVLSRVKLFSCIFEDLYIHVFFVPIVSVF